METEEDISVISKDSSNDSQNGASGSSCQSNTNFGILPLLPFPLSKGPCLPTDHASTIKNILRPLLETQCLNREVPPKLLEKYKSRLKEINEAEEEIMKVQAHRLQLKEKGPSESRHSVEKKLDISDEIAEKFKLIKCSDIFDNISIPPDELMVDEDVQKCPLKHLDGSGPHSPRGPLKQNVHFRKSNYWNHQFNAKLKNRPKLKNKMVDEEGDGCIVRRHPFDEGTWEKQLVGKIIEFVPHKIIFKSCNIGTRYSENFMVKNAYHKSVRFDILLDKVADSPFDLIFSKPMFRHFSLAPGIKMDFEVRFNCVDNRFCKTWLNIHVVNGPHYRVEVVTKRLNPTLIAEPFFSLPNGMSGGFRKSGAFTIDCGITMMGNKNVATSELCNVGSDAEFHVLSESTWELDAKQMQYTDDNTLTVSSFQVFPQSFKLGAGESIKLTVTFAPDCENLYLEKLVILCNNFTLRTLDLLGEAVMFNPEDIAAHVPLKHYDVDEPDDYDAFHCIDFGDMRKHTSSSEEIIIENYGATELEVFWELRPMNDALEQFRINPNLLKVTPKMLRLCPFSVGKAVATVKAVADMADGVHKMMMCLVAANIPLISFETNIIPHKTNPNGRTANIDLALIEVRLAIKRVTLTIEPPLFVFQESVGKSKDYDVVVKNWSDLNLEDVQCHLPEGVCVKYFSTQSSLKIAGNGTSSILLKITGARKGKVRDTIRFTYAEDNFECQLVVTGEVLGAGYVHPYSLRHDYGTHEIGSDIKLDIPLIYDSPKQNLKEEQVICTEYKPVLIDDDNLNYEITHSPDEFKQGWVVKKNDSDKTHAEINFSEKKESEGTKLLCSFLQLKYQHQESCVDIFGLGQECDFVLDRYDVHLAENFYRKTPISFMIVMTNKNLLSSDFHWSVSPVSLDVCPEVAAEFNPRSGVLWPFGQETVQITLTAEMMGLFNNLILLCTVGYSKVVSKVVCSGLVLDVIIEVSFPTLYGTTTIEWPK